MSSPMQVDVPISEPTRAQHGRQVWDDVAAAMAAEMDDRYGETVTPEQVEDYLRDELGLTDPYDEEYEPDADFDFDDDAELVAYLVELESVKVEDVYLYVFGELAPDEDEEEGGEADEDGEDGEPVLLLSDDEEGDEVAVDPYYSSDDDEEPENQKEFRFVLDVARAADRELDAYLAGLPQLKDFLARIALMITKITKQKQTPGHKTFPKSFFPMTLAQPGDWPTFCRAMSIAKRPVKSVRAKPAPKPKVKPAPEPSAGKARGLKQKSWLTKPVTPAMKPAKRKAPRPPKPQKPTVYEFDFAMWSKATHQQVSFRGKQLKTPSGDEGRSWPEIAYDLDRLAVSLGGLAAPAAEADVVSNVGNRILATAILFILAGRGDEVRAALAGAKFSKFAAAESTILEFLTLAYAIEGARLAFAQLDTLLHLANIAAGARFRGPKSARRYTFLNVYSSVRAFPRGPEHVYVEGIYVLNNKGEKTKELTRYEGFMRAPLIESLDKQTGQKADKSGKSVGKSIYSHSAAHARVVKLLAGDQAITDALWEQVRPVGKIEDRRELHGERFGTMGPIRLYNLMANVLRGRGDALKGKSAKQTSVELIETFGCFFAGQQPPAGSAFRDLLPTSSGAKFDALVTIILQQEKVQEADKEMLALAALALAKNRKDDLDRLESAGAGKVAPAVAHLVRTNFEHEGQPALHLAARTGRAWLVRLMLDAGADVTAENAKGETAQAFAGAKADKEVVAALTGAQKRQLDSQSRAMPKAWSSYGTRRKLGADWFTDADVRRLLTAANLADTELMPAVDIFAHPDALATFIRDNYLGQMAAGAVRRFTVVPINFNDAHWAALVIVQNPDRRSQPTVYFFDSLGSDDEKRAMVLAMLHATGVYTRVTPLTDTDLSAHVQTDDYTCGSWLVHAATTIVTRLRANQSLQVIRNALAAFAPTAVATHRTGLAGRPGSGGSGGSSKV